MPAPSLAREFFDRIVSAADQVAAIRGLVNLDPALTTVESDWLDFKTEDARAWLRDKQIKEAWSEALGGFANNQGGVLIWGVDARKKEVDGREIDAAHDLKPITDPLALESTLRELQRGATDPPLANVEIKAYSLPSDPGKGFVVCFVPEGPFKPYRSEQAGQQWYIRAGDNFVIMSPAMLRAMFYPRAKAVFFVEAAAVWASGRPAACAFQVWLGNKGPATAKDVHFRIESDNLTPHAEAEFQPTPAWLNSAAKYWRGPSIHPGTPPSLVFRMNWPAPTVPFFGGAMPKDAIEFSFAVYAENQEPQRFKVRFDVDELTAGSLTKVTAFPEELVN